MTGIQTKLAAILLALMVAASIITSLFFYTRVKGGLAGETGRHLRSLAQTSALMIDGDAFLNVLQDNDPVGFLDRTIRRKMKEIYSASPNVQEMIVVGRLNGAMKVAVSIPVADLSSRQVPSDAVAYLEEALSGMVATDLSGLAGAEGITYGYAPIFDSAGNPVGALRIGYSTAAMARVLQSLKLRAWTAFLICALLSLLVSYCTARHLVRPIRKLAEATSRMADGELGQKVEIASRDEFGELAQSFTIMSEKLKRAYEQLQEKLGMTDQELVKTNRELAAANKQLQQTMDELKVNQERLVQSEKLAVLGEMAACVAHEVRNPLSVIRSSAQLLIGKDREKVEELVRFIQEEVSRLDGVVENFLRFSRPVKVSTTPEDFNEVVEYASKIVDDQATGKQVEVVMDFSADTGTCDLDRDQFRQLLMNLLLNAIDASPQGGTVTVSTASEGEWNIVTVCDQGSGIETEIQDRLFEPFVTTKREGTGLGLSICRQIAHGHNGELELQTSGPQGTCFLVRVPRKGVVEERGTNSRS